MAKQKGIIPLKGTIGNITFYKSADGYLAREKGGVDGNRIANDPAFQRTRENGAEFGRAGVAGKILRTAIRTLLQATSDAKMVGRLTREMVKVLQADTVSPRGFRNVVSGELEMLEGFEFNINSKLGTTLFAPFTATVNRVTGELTVNIASFIPSNMVAAPAGSTHFKIISGGAEVNFESEESVSTISNTAELPLTNAPTAVINLTSEVTANTGLPIFLVVGIEFYQEVNGTMYSLKNNAFNALSLVRVSLD